MTPEETWKEVGFKVRPTGRKIFCRTVLEKSNSLLVLPLAAQSFFYGDANKKILNLKVLSVGPNVKAVKKGAIICCRRMEFGRIWEFKDGTKGGWIDESQVLGFDTVESEAESYVLPSRNEKPSKHG
jgi:hypothetical protein